MTLKDLDDLIAAIEDPAARSAKIAEVRGILNARSPQNSQPVDAVRWVPIAQVQANDYNPNSVASTELGLLYTSILHDGYTQPIVTIYDAERDRYVIVDGFHRYFIAKTHADILARNNGLVPVVVINKGMNDRMASTVRHNRARGEHSVTGMAQMIFSMLEGGWTDAEICEELGMEPEELVKLKHLTGFSKLFESASYALAWETKHQIRLRKQAERSTT